MATEIKGLSMASWIQISNGEKAASVKHMNGGEVIICQSTTKPSGRPEMARISKEDPYFFTTGISPEELWAFAYDIDTEISYTAAN